MKNEKAAFFVDLDLTILNGIACQMSDDELREADFIDPTMDKINSAKALGMPVVIVSRNTRDTLIRVFELHPELAGLFDQVIPTSNRKSDCINEYLAANDIEPENAVFVDDTAKELTDVAENSEGVQAVNTDQVSSLKLAA